jgi:hypothetical protein
MTSLFAEPLGHYQFGRKEAVGKLYTCRLGERLRTRAMAMKLRDRNVLIISNVPRLRNSFRAIRTHPWHAACSPLETVHP